MASNLKEFKRRALARTDVKIVYDELAEEFAFFDEVLKARAESGLTQAGGRGSGGNHSIGHRSVGIR